MHCLLPFIQIHPARPESLVYFCCMRTKIVFSVLLSAIAVQVQAQEKWDLRRCVDYAVANAISVKQAEIQQKLSEVNLTQSKQAQYPSLVLNNNYGKSFGLRENPTTGIFEDQSFFNVGLNMQSSATIFNFFSRKNTILANEFDALAAKASVDKQKNDLSLFVANAYLQVLLSREQEKVAAVQLQQSQAQLDNTRKLVRAGALPELNAAELEAQVARDTANLIAARGTVDQNLLSLKNLMNLDASTAFDVAAPPVELIPVDPIGELQPEAVYALAVQNQPQQQINNLRYKAGEKNLLAARAQMKPSIGGFAGLSTNYIYFKQPVYERIQTGSNPTGLKVTTPTGTYDVLSPVFAQGARTGFLTPNSFGSQLRSNFGQNFGLGISVPIFNGGSLRANYQRAKLNLQSLNLQKDQDNLKLKQDIYQAYLAAVTAMQRFEASKKSVEAASRTYEFARKRADIGMLGTFELITNQNNLFRTKLELVANQFDYVFKMKVLEFYKGQGIKL